MSADVCHHHSECHCPGGPRSRLKYGVQILLADRVVSASFSFGPRATAFSTDAE